MRLGLDRAFVERWHLSIGVWAFAVGVAVALVVRADARDEAPVGSGVLRDHLPLLTAVAAVALWATVPDTEAPLVVGASLVPSLLVAWWWGLRWPRWVHGAILGAVAWAAWVGSAGWGRAVCGAVCCLALPASAVIGRRHAGGGSARPLSWVAHLAACVVGSRIVAHETLWVAAVLTAAVVALAVVAAGRSPGSSGDSDDE